jgi:threonine synthase
VKFADAANRAIRAGLRRAVLYPLAPEGGSWLPADDADLRQLLPYLDETVRFDELAEIGISALFGDEIDPVAAARIAKAAFPFSPAVRRIDDRIHALELFHGPTGTIKDFGFSFLSALIGEFGKAEGRPPVLLAAGSAAVARAAVRAASALKVGRAVVVVPRGKLAGPSVVEGSLKVEASSGFSGAADGNALIAEVDGSPEDCARLARAAISDPSLAERLFLVSADTLNIGRIIPLVFCYVFALARLKREAHGEFFFSVPCGSLATLTAGIYAWRWGLPITGYIAASNANDAFTRYLLNGTFAPLPVVACYSEALDQRPPAELPRLEAAFGGHAGMMRTMVFGASVSEDETLDAMRRAYEKGGVLLDPHSAVGFRAAERVLGKAFEGQGRAVTLATADPALYVEAVKRATGVVPEPREGTTAAYGSAVAFRSVANDPAAFIRLVESFHE